MSSFSTVAWSIGSIGRVYQRVPTYFHSGGWHKFMALPMLVSCRRSNARHPQSCRMDMSSWSSTAPLQPGGMNRVRGVWGVPALRSGGSVPAAKAQKDN
jgi:hypothetical protein